MARVPHRLTRAAVGALAVAALAAPTAGARLPTEELPGTTSRADAPATVVRAQAPAPTVTQTVDDGFDWGSAAIGAGAAGAVALVAAAGASAVAHHHRRLRATS